MVVSPRHWRIERHLRRSLIHRADRLGQNILLLRSLGRRRWGNHYEVANFPRILIDPTRRAAGRSGARPSPRPTRVKGLSRFPDADLEVWLLLAVEAHRHRVQEVVWVIHLQRFFTNRYEQGRRLRPERPVISLGKGLPCLQKI